MCHEHRSELQFNQAACPGSYRSFPGVTRNSRELQADISEPNPKQNPLRMNFPNQIRPNENPGSYMPFSGVTGHFRELQAVFGSYRSRIWFGHHFRDLVRIASDCFGICFGLLRALFEARRFCFGWFTRDYSVSFGHMVRRKRFEQHVTDGVQMWMSCICVRC